jgi:hypothetical protein
VIHLDPALGKELFDVPEGQAETQAPADSDDDDIGREPESGEGRAWRDRRPRAVSDSHDGVSPHPPVHRQRTRAGCKARVGRLAGIRRVSSGSVRPHDAPVTENHVVEEGPTKMIGARHGRGSVTVALISESPVAVAGKGAVATFVVVGLPATVVRQLTIA